MSIKGDRASALTVTTSVLLLSTSPAEQLRHQKVFFDTNMFHGNSDDSLCKECIEAQTKSGIDVKRLLSELTKIKQNYYPGSKELSYNEVKYLCLSLSLYSKGKIAYYIYRHHIPSDLELAACEDENIEKWIKNINSEMSTRINKYVKCLMNLTDENKRLPLWKNIIVFLENRGYGINKKSTSGKKQHKLSVLVYFESNTNAKQLDDSYLKKIEEIFRNIGVVNIKISQIIDRDL